MSRFIKAGVGILAAVLFSVSLLLGQANAAKPLTHGGHFQPSQGCYGNDCNGKDPYWSGCTTNASVKTSLNVTATETVSILYSVGCNAVYTEIDSPGTTTDIDATISSGSVSYFSGFQAFSPTRSPMIGLGNGGSYTYAGEDCHSSQNCTGISFAFPDFSNSPTSDQSAQIRSRLNNFAMLVSGDQLGQTITAIGNASDVPGCASAINDAKPYYVNGIYSLIFLTEIASSCGKVVLEQISQDIESWGMKGYVNVNSTLESIDDCMNSGACDAL